MRKIYNSIFISICVITIHSCSDYPVSSYFSYDLVSFINGEILDLPDDAKLLKAIVQLEWSEYTVDSVNAGHGNTMQLDLSPADPEFLFDIDNFIYSDPTVHISDHDAKINVLSTYAFYDYSGDYAGELIKDNSLIYEPFTPGYFYVIYVYCDRSLRIEGFNVSTFEEDKIISSYNVNMAKGWNVLIQRYMESGSKYPDEELFNGEPPGANWFFVSSEKEHFRKPAHTGSIRIKTSLDYRE